MSLFSYFWGAVVILLPIIVFKNNLNDVRLCKDYLLFFFTALSCLIWHGTKIRLSHIIVSGLIISIVWFSIDNFYSAAVIQQTTYITTLVLLCVNLQRNMSVHFKNTIVHFFRMSLFIQVLFFITQSFGFNIYNPDVPLKHVVGSLGQHTLSGAYIACLLPFTMNRRWLWLCLLGCACLLSTWSAMALGSAVIGLIVMFPRLWWILLLSPAALLGDFSNDHGRYIVWKQALEQFNSWELSDKLFGRGFGYFWDNFKCVGCTERFVHAHNDYMEVLWSLGFTGLLGLLSVLVWPLFSSWGSWNTKNRSFVAALIAIIANAVANFPFFVSSISLVFMICYSIVITYGEDK